MPLASSRLWWPCTLLWSHSWHVGLSATLLSLISSPLLERAPRFASWALFLKGKVHPHTVLCWQCPQSPQKPWATKLSCKAFQGPVDPGHVCEGHLLCHIASVVGTKGCLSEDLSSSWTHMPCRAHSSLRCATERLEVSHHFIFGDFLMCLFLFFSKQQQRHCCIWQKNKALLFKACVLQYQLGQTHHCTLRPPSQKPAGQRVKRVKITS